MPGSDAQVNDVANLKGYGLNATSPPIVLKAPDHMPVWQKALWCQPFDHSAQALMIESVRKSHGFTLAAAVD
jgi:hypothetical protein